MGELVLKKMPSTRYFIDLAPIPSAPGFARVRVRTARGTGAEAYGDTLINRDLLEERTMVAMAVWSARKTAMAFRRRQAPWISQARH